EQLLGRDGAAFVGHRPKDRHALPSWTEPGVVEQRPFSPHRVTPRGCRRNALRPTTIDRPKNARDVSTMLPPGVILPCSMAATSPTIDEVTPTAMAISIEPRKEWAMRDPAATGITSRAEISSSPTA